MLLANFSQIRLIQVIQGAALVDHGPEPRGALEAGGAQPGAHRAPRAARRTSGMPGAASTSGGRSTRRLVAVGLGTAAFSMQDILLEPYGGADPAASPSAQTTALTALLAAGGLIGFVLAARLLGRGADPPRRRPGRARRRAGVRRVIFAAPLGSRPCSRCGAALIGFGGGLFAHATLTAAMSMARDGQIGLALGAWGAVQATAAGVRHRARRRASATLVSGLADGRPARPGADRPGHRLRRGLPHRDRLLFATMVAIGPLVRVRGEARPQPPRVRPRRVPRLATLPAEVQAMTDGAITGYIDVAQVVLYAFWSSSPG